MSGGSMNYFYSTLEEHVGDFGDKELDDLVKDLVELFHDREWYLSGDTDEGPWRAARDKFKIKWFTEYGRERRIEQYLKDLASEIFEMLGFGYYCGDCKEWTERNGDYGKCRLNKNCLMHRCDKCDMYEKG